MATKKKTKRKTAKKKAVKRKTAKKPVNVFAGIEKINNTDPEMPGRKIVNGAIGALNKHIGKKPVDSAASKKARRHLENAVKEFKWNPDQKYTTTEAKKLSAMVDQFCRDSANSVGQVRTALAFKDRVEKANKAKKGKPLDWSADDLYEVVTKIPGIVKDGVPTQKELEAKIEKATKAGRKFVKKTYRLTKSFFNAGKDPRTDLVQKKGRNYIPRPKSAIKEALHKGDAVR